MPWVSLCEHSELVEGQGKYVEIDGFRLGVYLDGGGVFVLDDVCPHAGAGLSGGPVVDGCVVCPLHYWTFRLDSGELKDSPNCRVKTYRVRVLQREGKAALVQAELPLP